MLRRIVSNVARAIYRRVPLSFHTKMRIKSAAFRIAPLLFRHTRAYRDWAAFEHREVALPSKLGARRLALYPNLLRAAPPARPVAAGHRADDENGARATKRENASGRRIAVICHDAHPHGAQYLALHLVGTLRELSCEVEVVLLGDGSLRPRFESLAPVHFLGDVAPASTRARSVAQRLAARGFASALCNTTATGAFAAVLSQSGIDCTVLIHELPGEIRRLHLQEDARLIAQYAQWIVFPARTVVDGFARFAAPDPQRIVVRPQGLYKRNRMAGASDRRSAQLALREAHGWPGDAALVLAVGQASLRKGADLFVEVAARVLQSREDVRFLWVGEIHTSIHARVNRRIAELSLDHRLVFAGPTSDTDPVFAGADLFLLPSREDPFPSVVLEAMQMGLPIVGFDCAGGFVDLLKTGCGYAVPGFVVPAMAAAVLRGLEDREERARIAAIQQQRLDSDYCFRRYASELRDLAISPASCHVDGTAVDRLTGQDRRSRTTRSV